MNSVSSSASSWNNVIELADRLQRSGAFRAISIQACDAKQIFPPLFLGEEKAGKTLSSESLFLVASLTKPVVATLVLKLVQEGLLTLNQRVSEILPEWDQNGKRRITVRHLLAHTSGLPDQLPSNLQLRAEGADLEKFYQGTVEVPLEFSPGSQALYQSMGFVVLAKLVETISGKTLPQLLDKNVFKPLMMNDSSLGFAAGVSPEKVCERLVEIELGAGQQHLQGNWNSRYWQGLGAPWGGMLSTVGDLLRFCRAQFSGIQDSVISPALANEAMQNQLTVFEEMNSRDLKFRPWGLGWRWNWKNHRETFGDFLSEHVVGHWGATGTMMWLDREKSTACVICCSRPAAHSRTALICLSNAVSTALESV